MTINSGIPPDSVRNPSGGVPDSESLAHAGVRAYSTSRQDTSKNTIHPSLPTAKDDNAALTARRAVAHAVQYLRRWDEPGILAAWDTAAKRGHDFTTIAVCLLESAADPGAKTPGVLLSRLANGWRKSQEPPTPLPKQERCAKCHIFHAPNTPCGSRSGTEPPAEYIEAKRTLLHEIPEVSA